MGESKSKKEREEERKIKTGFTGEKEQKYKITAISTSRGAVSTRGSLLGSFPSMSQFQN